MFNNDLSELAEYILQQNAYFVEGYYDVYMSEKGVIHNREVIFPADYRGNYFYLRRPRTGRFVKGSQYEVSNCRVGRGATEDIVLVAFMRDADPDKLLSNIISTLSNYGRIDLDPLSFIGQSDYVVLQELAQISEGEQEAALQRIDPSYTMVSVTFTITKAIAYNRPNCNQTPCKIC